MLLMLTYLLVKQIQTAASTELPRDGLAFGTKCLMWDTSSWQNVDSFFNPVCIAWSSEACDEHSARRSLLKVELDRECYIAVDLKKRGLREIPNCTETEYYFVQLYKLHSCPHWTLFCLLFCRKCLSPEDFYWKRFSCLEKLHLTARRAGYSFQSLPHHYKSQDLLPKLLQLIGVMQWIALHL